jgi:hypothetical protein
MFRIRIHLIRIRIQSGSRVMMTSKIQKKPSALKREHPALQKMQFLNFLLLLCVIFAHLDPDPDSESGSGYGSIDLIESGSETLLGMHGKKGCICKLR